MISETELEEKIHLVRKVCHVCPSGAGRTLTLFGCHVFGVTTNNFQEQYNNV